MKTELFLIVAILTLFLQRKGRAFVQGGHQFYREKLFLAILS